MSERTLTTRSYLPWVNPARCIAMGLCQWRRDAASPKGVV